MIDSCNAQGWYSRDELFELGFMKVDYDVHVSRKASIYNMRNSILGNHIKIDDFCFLLGNLQIGNHVHIAPYCISVGGEEGICMDDFSGLSSRGSVYASSDDYSGEYMTNPTIPSEYKKTESKRIFIGKHAIIGSTSVIMPGVTIGEGCSCGAMSFINCSTEPWSINVGVPAKKISVRKKDLLDLEQLYRQKEDSYVKLGEEKCFYKVVEEKLVLSFAEASNDINPIHIDEKVAADSIFGRRVAHGMLIGSFISAIIGNDYPGNGSIYMQQELKFLRPVYIGEKICIGLKAVDISSGDHCTMEIKVYDSERELLIVGKAVVKLPYKVQTVM